LAQSRKTPVGKPARGQVLTNSSLLWIGNATWSPARRANRVSPGTVIPIRPAGWHSRPALRARIAPRVHLGLVVHAPRLSPASWGSKFESNMTPCKRRVNDKPPKSSSNSMRPGPGLKRRMNKRCAAVGSDGHATSGWRRRSCNIYSRPPRSIWCGWRNGLLGSLRRRLAAHASRLYGMHNSKGLTRRIRHQCQCWIWAFYRAFAKSCETFAPFVRFDPLLVAQ